VGTRPETALVVASNRGPLSFTTSATGDLVGRRGGGGLVAGLSALGPATWFCAAMSEADRQAVRTGAAVADRGGDVRVRMLDLPADIFDAAYSRIANRTLWFVHHLLFDLARSPSFGASFHADWQAYRSYNATFADAIADEAAADATVLVQDYHLALVPALLRHRRPDLRVGHFCHTPWAPPDYLQLLPVEVVRELLRGHLAADSVGFLSPRWAADFLACCVRFLGAEVASTGAGGTVTVDGRTTMVGVHPLGVDVDDLRTRAAHRDVEDRRATLERRLGGRRVVVRVDRAELSKNILRGFDAYAELLRRRPDLVGEVVHLVHVYPSRTDVPEYRDYAVAVREAAAALVAEFGRPDWEPLLLEVQDDLAAALAAYQLADVVLANPVRDGMNLVAKEAPVVSERDAVLVVSDQAGAADELGAAALVVNPFDVTATASALEQALAMPAAERADRRAELVRAAGACPPAQWVRAQVDALARRD
jgi:trehalose 6-phosphate synthase